MKMDLLKKAILNLRKYVLTFLLLLILLTAALVTVAKLPKSAIKKHMLSSATYLSEAGMGNYLLGSIKATCTDQFADSLLLNIAYNYDDKKPLKSIIWSAYSGDPSPEGGPGQTASLCWGKQRTSRQTGCQSVHIG